MAVFIDPERWLLDHGDYLYRYARRRLRERAAAEDAVQETLLAGWRGRASFTGESSERTWLTSILRHKIVDQLRKTLREQPLPDAENGEDPLDTLFDARGHWQFGGPKAWGDPEEALERNRFWQVFEDCLERLPPRLAAVFVLREVDGMHSDALCKELNITTTNVWVMLSRARSRLRVCLESRWFGLEGKK